MAQICILVLAAAVLIAPWLGHVDDTDAQLYQVVARGMAARHGWLDPRYLPGVYPHFREHLPFGLWPYVVAIRLFGEWALAPLAALFTWSCIGLTGALSRRLSGEWAAVVAMAVLATNESFALYGGRPRLDPLLVLLATAAVAPVLVGRLRARSWLLAGGFAALAALVKGPFGLAPLAAACVARALKERSWRVLVIGAAVTLAATLPVVGFLVGDHLWGGGTWWRGFGLDQLLASATFARHDGHHGLLFPFQSIAGRFWPGLPLVALGLWLAWRKDAGSARLLALFAVVLLGELCIPGRKVWNHELVAYPALALLAGAGTGVFLERLSTRGARRGAWVCGALALVAWAGALGGLGRLWDGPPCVGASTFAPWLSKLSPGDPVWVVSSPTSWRTVASLAAERRLSPYPLPSWPVPPSAHVPSAKLALVRASQARARAGWQRVSSARGWVLLMRRTAGLTGSNPEAVGHSAGRPGETGRPSREAGPP